MIYYEQEPVESIFILTRGILEVFTKKGETERVLDVIDVKGTIFFQQAILQGVP